MTKNTDVKNSHKKSNNYFKRRTLADRTIEAIVLLSSLIIIVPLLIMILGSFKNPTEAMKFNLELPQKWLWKNYAFVFTEGGIARALINSFIVTCSTIFFCVVPAAMASFIIARKKSRFTVTMDRTFFIGMIAPMQIIPTFAVLKIMGLIGTFPGVIFVMAAAQIPWIIFMFIGFFKDLPTELDEAAYIDGLSPFGIFVKIIVPVSQPIVATAVSMTAMYAWNEFMIPLYFFNNQKNWTMPLTVYNFFGQYFSNWNYVFADLMLTALPVVILYLYLQKYIVAGMTSGAVKG